MGTLRRRPYTAISKSVADTISVATGDTYFLRGVKRTAGDTLGLSFGEVFRINGVKKAVSDALAIGFGELGNRVVTRFNKTAVDILSVSAGDIANISGPGTLSIQNAAYTITEFNTLNFNVLRGNGDIDTVRTTWTVNVSQGTPSPVTGTVTFADRDSAPKAVSVSFQGVTGTIVGSIVLSNPENLDGGSLPSYATPTATLTILNDTAGPVSPALLATPLTPTSIFLTATGGTDAGAGFKDWTFQQLVGASWTTVSTQAGGSLTLGSLQPATTYQFRVIATDNAGNTTTSSTVSAATPAATTNTLKFHGGHWGQLRTVAGFKTSEGVILADLAIIEASASEPNIVGWAANFSWKQLETAPGVFSWTIPDRYFNACKNAGKRFMFRLDYRRYSGDGTQSVVPADMYPAGQAAAADGGATPRDWTATVMTRIIAISLAIAARYDADPFFEAFQGMVETSISFDENYPAPGDYTTANKKTQYKRWMDAVRGPTGFRTSQVFFGQNYLGDQNGSDCEEMIRYALPLRISCGGPDTWQYDWVVPPAQVGKRPIWNDEVLRGVRGSGFDYRPYHLWPREAQGTEMGGYIGNMLPQAILQTANYDGCQYMIWDYNTEANNPGSTPATQWGDGESQGILWVIRNFPLTNTYNPYNHLFDYFIDPTGSDSNAGTRAAPWAITALNSKRATYRGFRVGLIAGTYSIGSLYGAGDYNNPVLDLEGSNSVSSPTVIQSVQNHGAIIDSQLVGTDTRPALGNSSSRIQANLIIDGLYFRRSVSRSVKLGDYVQSPITGSIIIRNCRWSANDARTTPVTGGNNSCLEISNQQNLQVLNNLFLDNIGETLNSGDHHSAILAWKCKDCIIDGNTSVNSGSFFGKAEGHSGNILRNNYLNTSHITAQGAAIQDWCGYNTGTGNTTKIYNNVLIAMSPADIRSQYVQGTEFTQHAVEFYNNTCIIFGTNSFGLHVRTAAGLLKSYNNIFVSTATGDHAFFAMNVQANDGAGLVDYNVYHRASGTSQWATYANPGAAFQTRSYYNTLAAVRTPMGVNGLTGLALDLNAATADPVFAMTGSQGDLYKLQAGSPYKVAGSNPGRVGGVAAGAACERGAWGGASVVLYVGQSDLIRI